MAVITSIFVRSDRLSNAENMEYRLEGQEYEWKERRGIFLIALVSSISSELIGVMTRQKEKGVEREGAH
jgi:hypothetical protein